MKQPLLCIKTKNPDQPFIYLIPEFTIMTGFTDEMRSNYNIMKQIATVTQLPPRERAKELYNFASNFTSSETQKEQQNW